MRKITEIIVHCSATRPEWMEGAPTSAKVAEIRRWHVKDRGWRDIGYHLVVDRDGTVHEGRPLETDGAHVQGHNKGTIGICLIGGHGSSPTDKFDKNFTLEQENSLRMVLSDLKSKYPSITKITGHNDYSPKACPGFKVSEWLSGKPKSAAKSTTVQASAVQMVSGAGAGVAALGALDGTAQIVALVFVGIIVLAAAYIMRERLKKWVEGIQ